MSTSFRHRLDQQQRGVVAKLQKWGAFSAKWDILYRNYDLTCLFLFHLPELDCRASEFAMDLR